MNKEILLKELKYKAIRSSGAGGQHVNKVSSKVELSFNVGNSLVLSEQQKERLLMKLGNRMTKDGVLVLQCDEARSQHQNKALVIKRFFLLLKNALTVPKKRKPTKPSKSSIEKRLKSKKIASSKKVNRQKPDLD
ncbi:Class I peptide chain release factor [Croceitalea dokdonensis DOKDO 023]|uniref:Class I peptide chain release factor n=1 Tax=Croceitalea dokdonensis DOKDO 023 TaxID=1300341 RepID=A0A0P7AZ53_9FLAO|nr:alternative ribosome rescue aminoacyl-tRNA hydrolase ArfB [Croceitalea dokdonensis]KPM30824.1 Class I peptide chain release factor [Croceitalea dokdonensis DOKDO 023]